MKVEGTTLDAGGDVAEQQPLPFDGLVCTASVEPDRFWRQLLRGVVSSDAAAILELLSNSWDASASTVQITWPTRDSIQKAIIVADDGDGINAALLLEIWSKIAFDRRKGAPGEFVHPTNGQPTEHRRIFGRNGVGRFAPFRWADRYHCEARSGGEAVTIEVSKSTDGASPAPLGVRQVSRCATNDTGCSITVLLQDAGSLCTPTELREAIAFAFGVRAGFSVMVNGSSVDPVSVQAPLEVFEVATSHHGLAIVSVNRLDNNVQLRARSGLSWRVNHRRVGEPSWNWFQYSPSGSADGRVTGLRGYLFTVDCDRLADCVVADWSEINIDSQVKATATEVTDRIWHWIVESRRQAAGEDLAEIHRTVGEHVQRLGQVGRLKFDQFITEVRANCPRLTVEDLKTVGTILAKLERAHDRYSLLEKLGSASPDDLATLSALLGRWQIADARTVLDELKGRLLLVRRLEELLLDPIARELQDVHPMIAQGLWILSPEYESAEFTSNRSLCGGVAKLLNLPSDMVRTGRGLRPDFLVLQHSSVGVYARRAYERTGEGAIGLEAVCIVELKRPGLSLGEAERTQVDRYRKHLVSNKLITDTTRVKSYLLGSNYDDDPHWSVGSHYEGFFLSYDAVIARARSRTFELTRLLSEQFRADGEDVPMY